MTARPSRFPMAWPRWTLALGWGGVAASLALAPMLHGAAPWVLALPWLVSTALLGLPHGSADLFIADGGWPRSGRAWGRVAAAAAAYLALAAAYGALWLAVPVGAAMSFLLLTAAHWGQGDVYALRAMGWDAHLPTLPLRAWAGAVRGALPMAVPLAAFPADYAAVVGAMVGAVRPERAAVAAEVLGAVSAAGIWAALLGLWAGYALLTARAAQRNRAWGAWRRDHAEVLLLAGFFAWVPPLWSVGVYFCLWHSLRHLARLAPLVARGSAWRLAGLCLPGTAGALVLMLLLLAREATTGDPIASTGAYLVGIAALTVPHVVVVAWMDVRQRVWTRPADPSADP